MFLPTASTVPAISDPRNVAAWLSKTPYAGIDGLTYQALPVGSIQRYSLELDEYFIVRRGGLFYLPDLNYIGGPVLCVNGCLHLFLFVVFRLDEIDRE